jgi:hypothetical protein
MPRLKPVHHISVSSECSETSRAFNSCFDTINLHRPTFAVGALRAAERHSALGVVAQVEFESKV